MEPGEGKRNHDHKTDKKQNINEHKHTVAAQTLLILNIFTRITSNIQVTWPHNTELKTNGVCVLRVHLCSRDLDRHRWCGQQTWGGRMHGWGVHGPQTTLTWRKENCGQLMDNVYYLDDHISQSLFLCLSNIPATSAVSASQHLKLKRSYCVSKARLLVSMFQLLLQGYSCSRDVSCRRWSGYFTTPLNFM